MRDLDAVTGRPHVLGGALHRLVDDEATGRPDLEPGRLPELDVGDLVRGDDQELAGDLAVGGADAADGSLVVAEDRLELGVEVQVGAHLDPRVLDRLGDVRVGRHRQRPRRRVDQVRLDAAVRQRGHHLQPERTGLEDDCAPYRVENLVPLHRLADVFHVVDAGELVAGHVGLAVVPAAGDHQGIEGHLLAPDRDRLGAEVTGVDPGLVPDVDALVGVLLLAAEEEPLEVGDLFAVHVGDATRAVGRVLVLREDHDLGARVGALGRAGRSDASRTSTDDDDATRHAQLLWLETLNIGYETFTMLDVPTEHRQGLTAQLLEFLGFVRSPCGASCTVHQRGSA